MNWSTVRWIFRRELRDQARDRRTLFMIAVLPLLLYPLLGMSLFQVVQFSREHATRVVVWGGEDLPEAPRLIDGDRFASELFDEPSGSQLLSVTVASRPADEWIEKEACRVLATGERELVLVAPAGFGRRLAEYRAALERKAGQGTLPGAAALEACPSGERFAGLRLLYSSAQEKSRLAYGRVSKVLDAWTTEIGRRNLAAGALPLDAAHPFDLTPSDVARSTERDAALWSKMLPFLLLIWSLTGAFYPAVDLCPGEKERGTLETLLSSPAERREIVLGKLLTVMTFSMGTAILNLVSLGVTGSMVLRLLPGNLGSPPPLAPLWLLLALPPVAALFSALCLALAAFARSSKEGQYYLMPLILVTMPLVMLPMAPGVELNLGFSLIPVTGLVLLLRAMLEGNYLGALPYLAPVIAVTGVCCVLAIRWAVDQFSSESVLFRESERLDLGLWLRRLRDDRRETPSVAEAILLGVMILVIQFFLNVALAGAAGASDLTVVSLITQLTAIATPALLMTIMLTRGFRQTLLLRRPKAWTIPAAIGLAVLAHPAVAWLNSAVQAVYPLRDEIGVAYQRLFGQSPSLAKMLLIAALVPAICEELAYRGFILSGLRRLGSRGKAIAISSFLFGVAHGVVQQSIVATLVGGLLGYLAIQTGSLAPGICYHFTHNALGILLAKLSAESWQTPRELAWLLTREYDGGIVFGWPLVVAGAVGAAAILRAFRRLEMSKSSEELLQELMDQELARAAAPARAALPLVAESLRDSVVPKYPA